MAINEQIKTGRKFRKLIDADSRLWLRISFWTKASDVEFDDHETAEIKFANMAGRIDEIASAFRNGVNKIYNKLKELGFTPAANSPDGICGAIQDIHDTRYTNGYNAGRLQGQEDVKANPGQYGVSTGIAQDQFTLHTSSRVHGDILNNLTAPHAGTCSLKFEVYLTYDSHSNANKCRIYVNRNNVTVAYADIEDDGFDIHPDLPEDKGTHQYTWKKTLEIPNCTSGETLGYKIVRDGADTSWIIGIY